MIICSNEDEEKSHVITKLHSYRRPFPVTMDSEQCKRYLKAHFTRQVESAAYSLIHPASEIDHEK